MARRNTKDEVLEVLAELFDAAMRVDRNHGHDEDGEPDDGSDWWELRDRLMAAKYCLKRNGALAKTYRGTQDLPESAS